MEAECREKLFTNILPGHQLFYVYLCVHIPPKDTNKPPAQSTDSNSTAPLPGATAPLHCCGCQCQAKRTCWHGGQNCSLLLESPQRTVCFESGRLTVPAACLVYGFNNEDVACPTLKSMDCVMVLFDVGHNHPAIHGIIQACNVGKARMLR